MKFQSFRQKLIEIAGVIDNSGRKRKHAIDLMLGKGLSMSDINNKYGSKYLQDVLRYSKKLKGGSVSKNIISRIKAKLRG